MRRPGHSLPPKGFSMQKTIFRRYLIITMAIVVLSFVMLGSVITLFFAKYWQEEKKQLLVQSASVVAQIASYSFEPAEPDFKNTITPNLNNLLNTKLTPIQTDVFITDLEGNIIKEKPSPTDRHLKNTVQADIISQIAEGGTYEGHRTLGGLYEENHLSVGVPIRIEDRDGNFHIAGAVFATTSASFLDNFQQDILEIFMVASLLALTVTFCVVSFFAYSLVKPLQQMNAVVKKFGDSDFSVRVPVNSQDEIGQLAVSFNNMADSISSSESMRRSFIANVSHELKTPMTTIAGFIDGILDHTIAEDQRDKYLHVVSDEVKRLSRLVKSMLDLSRIDSGEMKIHPYQFDLHHMVFQALLTFERSIEEKEITIEGLENSGHISVMGDQDLLHQVVYNLIENAVKFTNKGGTISFVIIDGIDRTSVAIENTGPGIDPEELSLIFDRFYKTDKSRSQDKNGMGLGLYIVRTIIRLHGGDITVRSQVNKYCRFEFYIPKRKPDPQLRQKENLSKEIYHTGEIPVEVYDAQIIEETNPAENPSRDSEE